MRPQVRPHDPSVTVQRKRASVRRRTAPRPRRIALVPKGRIPAQWPRMVEPHRMVEPRREVGRRRMLATPSPAQPTADRPILLLAHDERSGWSQPRVDVPAASGSIRSSIDRRQIHIGPIAHPTGVSPTKRRVGPRHVRKLHGYLVRRRSIRTQRHGPLPRPTRTSRRIRFRRCATEIAATPESSDLPPRCAVWTLESAQRGGKLRPPLPQPLPPPLCPGCAQFAGQ